MHIEVPEVAGSGPQTFANPGWRATKNAELSIIPVNVQPVGRQLLEAVEVVAVAAMTAVPNIATHAAAS